MSRPDDPKLHHPALDVLRAFWGAMWKWESNLLRERTHLDTSSQGMAEDAIYAALSRQRAEARDELAAIFNRYCQAGSSARRVKDVLHCGGEEPDYNPDKEAILSVIDRGDKVIVETQMTHQLCNRLRYELVKVNGDWKIRDNRKFYAPHWDKWMRQDL
jgi:hypothetical protein